MKGEAIPEIGRIIAVADAYDAMTSNRSYRSAIPQHIVREEIVKGSGTQFDPEFARLLIQMIDHDIEYRMQETMSDGSDAPKTSLRCDSVYHDCTEGYHITEKKTRIRLCCHPDAGLPAEECQPVLIVFDSLDGKVHPGEENNRDLMYCEFARIQLDGQVEEYHTRRAEVRTSDQASDLEIPRPESGGLYRVEAIRRKDHALVRITDAERIREVILALPDNVRFMYLSVSGAHCDVYNILAETDEKASEEAIPRIAEEISFIKGAPEGDVPNIEVDGWRSETTEGIPIAGSMRLCFHALSLPTARMVWHCPFVSVYSSADQKADGPDFREYILLRLDGENWESDEHVENDVRVDIGEGFAGWNDWKEKFKAGLDCTVTIERVGNRITMQTENLGVSIHSETVILDDASDVLLALTGDQCAITNIRVFRN